MFVTGSPPTTSNYAEPAEKVLVEYYCSVIEPVPEAATRRLRLDSVGALFAAVFGAHLAIALAVGGETWDDGYITLSLSRTFAETGHIGLTPMSEQVEAATSPLWFLMMAGVYAGGATGFYGFHFASQLVAGVCIAAAAVLFYRLIRPAAPQAAWWITLLVFLLGPIRSETGNGMEMSLLCLVVLGILTLLREDDGRHWRSLALLAALIPWIRLEATGYMIAGILAVWLFSPHRNRRSLAAIIVASFASVAVLIGVRYLVFGTVLFTNTMIAKQMPPYSPSYPSAAWWGQQLVGLVFEPVVTALPAVVVFLVLLRVSGQRFGQKMARLKSRVLARDVPLLVSFGLAYAIAFFIFTAVFGANTFTLPGRMGVSALIVLVIAAVNSVSLPERAYRPLGAGSRLALAGLFLVPSLGLIAYDTVGMAMRTAQLVTDDPRAKVFAFSAFRANGEAIERVRVLLGLPQISVLLTDVGQAALCCEKLEILDFGLLANSELTKTGWAGFPEYLRSQNPDLIQLHSSFTEESGITRDDYFKSNYIPVFVDNSLFYLRRDHYETLESKCIFGDAPKYYFFMGGEPLTSQRNSPADSALRIDKDYLTSLNLTEYCRLP